MENNKNALELCDSSFECRGTCLLNDLGRIVVWESVANHCKGTEKEQNLINNIFVGKDLKEKILTKYNFSSEEENIIAQPWKDINCN